MAEKFKDFNRITAAAVLMVALFAAVVSYTHIRDLAILHHNAGFVAWLTPLSVDGPIVASSLLLLYAHRKKLATPVWARATLWVSIGATLAANVAYGLPSVSWTWLGAVIAAWPALALVMVVESVLEVWKMERAKPVKRETSSFQAETIRQGIKTFNEARAERGGYLSGGTVVADLPNPPPSISYVDPPSDVPTKGDYHPLPTIQQVKDQLMCGRPKATGVRKIMKFKRCDIGEAVKLWEAGTRDV